MFKHIIDLARYLITVILICTVASSNAQAASEFHTSYVGIYELIEDGTTQVTHQISITNNLSQIFPKNYTLSIDTNDIKDLIVISEQNTPLSHELKETGDTKLLNITLDNPAIGQGRSTSFKVSYQTRSIAAHTGQVWELNIPRFKQVGELTSVKRTLIYPSSFGTPHTTIPSPDQITSQEDKTILSYEQSDKKAISVLFGKSQWYKLRLKYLLTLQASKATETEIAIPPDTPYQRVILESINPKPNNITLDSDGNWLARYDNSDEKTQNRLVDVVLWVEVSPIPAFYDPSGKPSKDTLSAAKYWESSDTIVKQTAEQLKTGENIYNYLVSNLTYNENRVGPGAERLGAAKALSAKAQAICTEFTDTFVALARSVNIHAREINGYAITSDNNLRPLSLETDVLHAWPEYYDQEKEIWRQVDPTWGHTTGGLDYFDKLDYAHITFVRHGKEPTYPYPAGVYKQSVNDKTISVELSSPQTIQKNMPLIEQGKDSYKIINTGKTAIINEKVMLPNNKPYTIEYLPPYGQLTTDKTNNSNDNSETTPIILSAVIAIVLGFTLYFVIYYLIRCKK